MQPTIQDGDILHVQPVCCGELRKGDIVLSTDGTAYRAHRIVSFDRNNDVVVTRGDAGSLDDEPMRFEQIRGRVVSKEDPNHRASSLYGSKARAHFRLKRFCGTSLRTANRIGIGNVLTRMRRYMRAANGVPHLFVLALIFLSSALAFGQVAFDTATSTAARVNGTTPTFTFTCGSHC